MTPTLLGRWQTRFFLLATVGTLVTLPFAWQESEINWTYFWVLSYVFWFGLAWDTLYDFLQGYMWDHDWPGFFQMLAAICEAVILVIAIKVIGLPHVPNSLDLVRFCLHYSSVCLIVYLASWVIMRLLFPHWRFRGGQWIGRWSKR